MKEIRAKERRTHKKKIVVPILLQFFSSSLSHAHFTLPFFSGLILRVAPDCIRPLSAIHPSPRQNNDTKSQDSLFFFSPQDIQSIAIGVITSTKICRTISHARCPLPRPQWKPAVGPAYRLSLTSTLTRSLTSLYSLNHSLTHSFNNHTSTAIRIHETSSLLILPRNPEPWTVISVAVHLTNAPSEFRIAHCPSGSFVSSHRIPSTTPRQLDKKKKIYECFCPFFPFLSLASLR